jgi:hypothetical protein
MYKMSENEAQEFEQNCGCMENTCLFLLRNHMENTWFNGAKCYATMRHLVEEEGAEEGEALQRVEAVERQRHLESML